MNLSEKMRKLHRQENYLGIFLRRDGNKFGYSVARLVYKAFSKDLKNFEEKIVLHKDRDFSNNKIENLYLGDGEDLSTIYSDIKRKGEYKGVSIRYAMTICIKGKRIIETFNEELKAAKRYDYYIKKYNLKREGNFINKESK